MTLIIRNHEKRQRNKNKYKMEYFIFASLPEVQYLLNWLLVIKHTSVLARMETNFYKPMGASVLQLLQQRIPDLHKALLQPGCTFYNSVDDRFTYACVPKWTDASMFCLPDKSDRNAVDISIHTHQLYKLEKLVSSDRRHSHTKAVWF